MSRQVPTLERLHFPLQYLEIGEAMAREVGADVDGFYAAVGLDLPRPFAPWQTMDGAQVKRAMQEFLRLCPPNVAPIEPFMTHFPLTVHGPVGMLAITSANLGEALQGAIAYAPLVMPAFAMHREDVGDEVHLVISAKAHFGEVHDFFTETVVLAPTKIVPFLRGPVGDVTVCFRHRPLGPEDSYQAAFPASYRFNADEDKLIFRRSALSTLLITPSKASHLMMRATLEQQRRNRHATNPVTAEVKVRVREALTKRHSLGAEDIAASMAMSLRTLSRRLKSEGVTLPQIKAEVSIEHARELLEETDKAISLVAELSGFADSTAFARAFKKATGLNPSDYRKKRDLT